MQKVLRKGVLKVGSLVALMVAAMDVKMVFSKVGHWVVVKVVSMDVSTVVS